MPGPFSTGERHLSFVESQKNSTGLLLADPDELTQDELSQLLHSPDTLRDAGEANIVSLRDIPSEESSVPYIPPVNTPAEPMSTGQSTDDAVVSSPSKSKPVIRIEQRIAELKRRMPIIRQPIPTADTIIYLGRLGLENEQAERELQQHFTKIPLLVERSRLMALNSPYFNKFLGPFYQTKRWKTFGPLVTKYRLPPNIKYIVNLTPDTEGLEAVEAIQDLSCPSRVLQWKESSNRWSVSQTLVGGEEETDGSQELEEYSRVRHVKSIERFMIALQGQDPVIDSATKLYSTVMVSKAWNIQGPHPVVDWAVGWLCADPNTRFIEALPESTLKMADVMKCASLCKDAFAILVGEAVLDSAVNMGRPGYVDDKRTMGDRLRGDVEEDWQNRIQHARNSFTDRIQRLFDDLVGEEMKWVSRLQEMTRIKISAMQLGKATEYDKFLDLFKRFIRGAIYKLLTSDYNSLNGASLQTVKGQGSDLYPPNVESSIWPRLRATERIFTRSFWRIINGASFGTIHSISHTNQTLITTHFVSNGLSDVCYKYSKTKLLEIISVSQLDKAGSLLLDREQNFVDPTARFSGSEPVKYQDGVRKRLGNMDSTTEAAMQTNQWTEETREKTNKLVPQEPNPRWKDYFAPGESEASQAAKPTSIDSIPWKWQRCAHWTCTTYLGSEAMRRECSMCGASYCIVHAGANNHRCSRHKASLLGAVGQDSPSNDLTSNASPQVLPFEDRRPAQTTKIEDTVPDMWNNGDFGASRPALGTAGQGKHDIQPTPVLNKLLHHVTSYLHNFARPILSGVDGGNLGGAMFDYHLVPTLTCLNEEETNFLPLWADGLDDGSGGIFSEHVPEASDTNVLGPGGRRYATRSEGSEYSFAGGSVDSTVNTSILAHDGYRDTLPRGQIITADDSDTSSIGGWSYIQGAIDIKKGKQPALFTPDDSEVATTLGALEDGSVIDLGIKTDKESSTSGITLLPQATASKMTLVSSSADSFSKDEDLGDFLMDVASDEEAFDSDKAEDSDIDFTDADEITMEEVKQSGASDTTTNKPSAISHAQSSKLKTSSKPAWENQESMANVYYVYKGGKVDDDDDDLMTRL